MDQKVVFEALLLSMELFEIQFRMKRVFASYFNQSHLKL